MDTYFEQDGKLGFLDLPFHISAIRFDNFCDFKTEEKKYLNPDLPIEERITHYDNALRFICPGDIDKLPARIGQETVEQLLDKRYTVPINRGHELSKDRIYAHIVNTIQHYAPIAIPTTFKFKYLGYFYQIEEAPVARVLADKPVTTGEAIEAMEYQRRAKGKIDESPDQSGNIDFNLGLTEFAILVKRKGEMLPSSRRKRLKFIDQRKEIFKGLDLQTVMNVRHFFLNALLRYATTPSTVHSGTALLVSAARPNARTMNGNVKRRLKKLGA